MHFDAPEPLTPHGRAVRYGVIVGDLVSYRMPYMAKRAIDEYKKYLIEEEKCSVTIEKYIRDITAFVNWTEGKEITKTLVLMGVESQRQTEMQYLFM